MVQQRERTYRIIFEYKDAWKPDSFRERYSEVLDRYDFIVGDWGYNQLRLKGFYRDDHPRATKETSISHLQDYLNEYCNFGCAYFVIERVDPSDRLNLDISPAETAITIQELPSSDRYAEWLAFKNKLQEEREQQKENGEEKNGRHRQRGQAGPNGNGGPSKGRRNGSVQDRRDRPETGDAPSQGARSHAKPAAGAIGEDKPQRANRQGHGGRGTKRHAGENRGQQAKRRGANASGRESFMAGGAALAPGVGAEPHARPADQARPADVRPASGAADGPRPADKPGHKRPWHRNRKNRQQGKWNRPRKARGEAGERPADGPPAAERTGADAPRRE